MLGELATFDSDSVSRQRLNLYAPPDVLLVDEVGYLSYSNHHADPLFELVSQRYSLHSTVTMGVANRWYIMPSFKSPRSVRQDISA